MGTPVPTDDLPIEDGEWWNVVVQNYYPGYPAEECEVKVAIWHDCLEGSVIKAWIRDQKQCTFDVLVGPPVGQTQTIISQNGPYPDEATCTLDNP